MSFSLLMDAVIALLLIATIAYSVRLNVKLGQLRKDKEELETLAKSFSESTKRAEEGISRLKVTSDALQSELKKAQSVKEDLAFLIERGGMTADEMVEKVRSKRGLGLETASDPLEDAARRIAEEDTGGGLSKSESDAERVLMKVLSANKS